MSLLNASDPAALASCFPGLPTAAEVAADPFNLLLDEARVPSTCWPFAYALAVVAPIARNSTQFGCTETNQTLGTMRTLIGPTLLYGTSRLSSVVSLHGVTVPDGFAELLHRAAGKITCDGVQARPEVRGHISVSYLLL